MATTNQLLREFEKVCGPQLEQVRKHTFIDGAVKTGLVPATGQYAAHLEDGAIRGHGHSRHSAIADLVEKLHLIDEEPFDHEAARADHIVSLRREA